MKNLIKYGPKHPKFKAHSFKCGGDYTLEINGERYPVELKSNGTLDNPKSKDYTPYCDVYFIHFSRDLIEEVGSIYPGKIYPGQECKKEYIPGVSIDISVPAERFASGEVKIYHGDNLINPDDVLTVNDNWMIDRSKVNLGSIWNLTIDGDPRFQNTLILITNVWGSNIEFTYQTKVIYSPEYSHIEAATGMIEFAPRLNADGSTININDYIDKIHLTLVKDNTNGGADMDRQHGDEIIYPRSYKGGFHETYPPIEFRKRIKRNPDEVYDDEYDEDNEY